MPMPQQPGDDSLWDFGNACHTSDLQKVTTLIEGRNRPLDYIILGLCRALRAKQMEVSRCLLDLGALTDGGVQRSALHSDSVEVLQLLLDYGWKVNDAGLHGKVALP